MQRGKIFAARLSNDIPPLVSQALSEKSSVNLERLRDATDETKPAFGGKCVKMNTLNSLKQIT